ncbi:hypothetical protein [Amycolatopsis pigmentata]|uniref:Uncharacterized protein n=1 Tax=Amycolatopsis pigmentata TaxID=450801 RepID=A0ABW5FKD6_9PSEU
MTDHARPGGGQPVAAGKPGLAPLSTEEFAWLGAGILPPGTLNVGRVMAGLAGDGAR